jgi:hypothetical protein
MKFVISGSAGRFGYVDGEHFIYSEIEREPRTWLSTGHGLASYALLHATDVVEVEAETVEEGLQLARSEAYLSKALTLLDTMLDPKEIWIDRVVAERLLRFYDTTAKQRIDDLLRKAPLPPGITVDALKAAIVDQPMLSEILGVIIQTHDPKSGLAAS